jgi:hypothetical protein
VPDGCGHTISCGAGCSSPDTCGGGGVANFCGCVDPNPPTCDCSVGSVIDACGHTINCACTGAGKFCCDGGCQTTRCVVCSPRQPDCLP